MKTKAEYAREYKERNPGQVKASQAAYYRSNIEKFRDYDLRRHYGIGLEDFNRILAEQNGRCAVCATDEPGGRGRFHVDHNHKTGEVRGLLCSHCNLGVGHFKDSPTLLKAAAYYLQRGKRH